MKRLFSLASLVCFVFVSAAFAFQTNAPTQTNILTDLLNLPAPPQVRPAESENIEQPARPPEFYDDKNAPPDDAPIEDVFDYWKRKPQEHHYGTDDSPKISAKNIERILEKLEKEPENLNDFLSILPDDPAIAEKVKKIFDVSQNGEDVDDNWRKKVKEWLKLNSEFYLDELVSEAGQVKDHLKYGSIEKDESLTALAKLNWKAAEPILQRLENDKVNVRAAALAKSLFYKHAIAAGDDSAIEKYRDELKEIVTDRNRIARVRDAAAEVLFETEWSGQEDFYFSLMEDETLLLPEDNNQIFSPLTTLPSKNPDKWIPILTKLIGNKNRAVHNAAVQSLMEFEKRKDALEPLLPWLSNPGWADIQISPGGRTTLMQIVSNFDLPESVPGLIWIVENEDDEAKWAAGSLAKFKDARAAPALKDALNRIKDESDRKKIIEALIACNGLTDDEQMSALEFYAEFILKPENAEEVQKSDYLRETSLPVSVSVGRFLSEQTAPSENLIMRLIERQKILEKEKPAVAKILSGIMSGWQGRLVDLEMLGRIERGEADVETIVGALARRAELRERVTNELYLLRGKSGLASALAACVLEDENDIVSAFHSQNKETSVGTLACARLLRKPLPIGEVGALLDSNDKLLALAAERYLEAEDSLEARNLVLARHKGEALILGARGSFNPAKTSAFPEVLNKIFATIHPSYANNLYLDASYDAELDKFENNLREELKTNSELLEVYGVYSNYIVRVYKTRVVLTWIADKSRFYEGVLKKEEFDNLKNFFEKSKFETEAPIFGGCHHNCDIFEYFRVNKNGGRRFFAYTDFMRFIGVQTLFQNLRESDSMKLRYYLQDKIKGLEVLSTDKRFQPRAIWKNGDDFRVLISDEERKAQIEEELRQADEIDRKNEDLDYEEKASNARKRRAPRAFEHYEWRSFKDGKLGAKTDEPREIPFLRNKLSFPQAANLSANDNPAQAVYDSYEIRAGEYSTGGLWKINAAEQIEFKKGLYDNPVVSGNWVIAAKAEESWSPPNSVVRVNLQTGKESKINLPPAEEFYPVALAAAHNKVLLYRAKETYSTLNPPAAAEYYLLDAKTGAVEAVRGEFQPLINQETRGLQPTGKLNEFWATVYNHRKNQTDVGVYNAKDFTFKSLLTLPEILLDSTEIWVDESEGKLYFIYAGEYGNESHLLALPLFEKQ